MKYGYEGVSLSNIIEEYHILNNRIVIKYLDGGLKSIEYTPENEQNTLNLMLEQAIRRNELYFYQNDKDIYEKYNYLKKYFEEYSPGKSEEIALIFFILFFSAAIFYADYLIISHDDTTVSSNINIFFDLLYSFLLLGAQIGATYVCLGCMGALDFISDNKEIRKEKKEIKDHNHELEKYALYLEMKDDFEYVLENSNYHDLFNGVKSDEQVLNINTLDNFSLKDIKKINSNLTGENNKALVRKLVR